MRPLLCAGLVVEDPVEVSERLCVDLGRLNMEVDAVTNVERDVRREASCGGVECRDTCWDGRLSRRSIREALQAAEDPVAVAGHDVHVAGVCGRGPRERSELVFIDRLSARHT